MVAQGEYKALCAEKNERVLDINVSCSVSLSCLFQTCQDLKQNFWVFCHFFPPITPRKDCAHTLQWC